MATWNEVSPNLGSSASPVSRRALKFFSSPLRLPFRHARVAACCLSIIGQLGSDSHVVSGAHTIVGWPLAERAPFGVLVVQIAILTIFDYHDL